MDVIQQIIDMRDENLTASEIAEALCQSVEYVKEVLRQN